MHLLLQAALLLTLVAATRQTSEDIDSRFAAWMQTHQRTYETPKLLKKARAAFQESLERIAEHGRQKHSFSIGLNKFSDMPNSKFRKHQTGFRAPPPRPPGVLQGTQFQPSVVPVSNKTLPDAIDWRQLNAVTPVRNQGNCGSCWSFSAAGAIEGACAVKTGKLVTMCEQQFIDCVGKADDCYACNGGFMEGAFAWAMKGNRVSSAEHYGPYLARKGRCKSSRTLAPADATVSKYWLIKEGSEEALRDALSRQPIAVAIDASHSSLQAYTKGVYEEPDCSSQQLDHGVLAVGYGKDADSGKEYWLIKNSWGADWGEGGYFKLARNQGNKCGVATMASYPEC